MTDYRLMGFCRFDNTLLLPGAKRLDRLPENPKTVIVCLFPYHVKGLEKRNVARFACVEDYHRVAGDILEDMVLQLKSAFPKEEYAAFVDISPLREAQAAARAGLGVIGRHGLLIHETFGTRVFIGEIVTTLELKPPKREQGKCLECGRCVKACPTGALGGGKGFERKLCRSGISQLKGGLSDWESLQLKEGGLAWGCDICADVCPHNRDVPETFIREFLDGVTPVLTRENMAENIRRMPYGWRGKATLSRNLDIIGE